MSVGSRYFRDADEDVVVGRMLTDKLTMTRNASFVIVAMSIVGAIFGEWAVVSTYSLFGLLFWVDVFIMEHRIKTNRFGTRDFEVDQINDWILLHGGHQASHEHLPG